MGQEISSVVMHELVLVVKRDLWGFCEVWVVSVTREAFCCFYISQHDKLRSECLWVESPRPLVKST